MEELNVEKSLYEHVDINYLRKVWDILIASPELDSQMGKYMVVDGYSYTRYKHTLDVVDIAERLARALRPNDEKFILMVKIAALAHDIGQGINHETEMCSSDILIEEGNSGFAHPRHSVRTANSILSLYGLSLIPEIESAILSHSSSSLIPPESLIGQIVLVADKISYCISDIKNLEDLNIINSKDLENVSIEVLLNPKLGETMLKDVSDLKTAAIEEALKNGIEKTAIGYAKVKKYFGYKQKEDMSAEEKLEREQILSELEHTFPIITALYKTQVYFVKPALLKKTNNKIKNEFLVKKFGELQKYFTTHSDVLKEILLKMKPRRKSNVKNGQLNRLTRWTRDYDTPYAVAYCLQSFDANEIEYLYDRVEGLDLSLQLKAKSNYLMDTQKIGEGDKQLASIISELRENGYNLVVSEPQIHNMKEYYYDTANYDFKKQKYFIRTREFETPYGKKFEGVVRKMHETKANEAIQQGPVFPLLENSLKALKSKISTDAMEGFENIFEEVEDNPKVLINVKRRIFEFKNDADTLQFHYDDLTSIDPSTGNEITTINRLAINSESTRHAHHCLYDILDNIKNVTATKKTPCEISYDELIALKNIPKQVERELEH